MLSQNELSTLYQIISDEKQTFDNISQNIHNNFTKDNITKICTTLVFLIKDNILNLHQRIISYFILYDISKKENIELNPYLSIILNMLNNSKNNCEKYFLVDFLNKKINYLHLTVYDFLRVNNLEYKMNLPPIPLLTKQFREYLKKGNMNVEENGKVRPVIYDRKKSDIFNINFHPSSNFEKDCDIKEELNINHFTPNYMSCYPFKNYNFLDSEPIWILPNLKHNFIFEKCSGIK